jgi:TRAP-type uncharacterized transport system substrate-binding protein
MLAGAALSGLLLGALAPAMTSSAHAQNQAPESADGASAVVVMIPDAETTAGIIGGEPGSATLTMVNELALKASAGGVRVVPVAGKGPLQNLADLLNLKGVDAAITQTDIFDYAVRGGLIDGLADKLSYMTRLGNAEFHLIARSDETGLAALAGRKINTGVIGSGIQFTASRVLAASGIDFVETSYDTATALALLKRGEIDGMVYIDSAPAPLLQTLDPADGLKLVDVPMTPAMAAHYQPAWLRHAQYDGLVAQDKMVETVSVGTLLIGFNWPVRSKGNARLQRLYESLAENLPALADKPAHPAWRFVTLTAQVPGRERHQAALIALPDDAGGTQNWQSDRLRTLRSNFKAVLFADAPVPAKPMFEGAGGQPVTE